MDKTIERGCLNTAYDKLGASDVRIIDSESPDYLVDKGGKRFLGVEVTEIYANQGAARVVKIKGYSTHILSKKPYRHKDDVKYLPVQKVRYSGNEGGKEIEVDALVQQLPSFPERVALLIEKIAVKTRKIEIYKSKAPEIDLLIYDPTGLYSFSDFSTFFPALSYRLGRRETINSKFREIVLLIRKIGGKTIRLPVKLNILMGELIAFQTLIGKSRSHLADKSGTILYLVAALNLAGFHAVRASIENRVFCVHCGPWTVRYEKGRLNIIDGTLQETSPKAEPVQEAVSLQTDLNSEERKFVRRLVARRKKVVAYSPLFFEFDLDENLERREKNQGA
jgi:hypothetical protein